MSSEEVARSPGSIEDQLHKSMRATIDRCRRLAANTTDRDAAAKLLKLADELEFGPRRASGADDLRPQRSDPK